MSIEQFIDNEVKSNDVVLFMKGTPQFPQCGFSGQVVQILDHVGVGYKGLNVLESAELRNGIKEYSNWPTIPQLYVKGEFVGGCDIIREMFQAGELQQLFADKGVSVGGLGLSAPARQIGRRGWKSLLPTSPACALTPSSTPRIRRCLAGAASMARSMRCRAGLWPNAGCSTAAKPATPRSPRLSASGAACDPHGRAGVERRQSRRGRSARLLLSPRDRTLRDTTLFRWPFPRFRRASIASPPNARRHRGQDQRRYAAVGADAGASDLLLLFPRQRRVA